jgi:hypothetical protein
MIGGSPSRSSRSQVSARSSSVRAPICTGPKSSSAKLSECPGRSRDLSEASGICMEIFAPCGFVRVQALNLWRGASAMNKNRVLIIQCGSCSPHRLWRLGYLRRRSDGLAGYRSRRTRGSPAGGRPQRHVNQYGQRDQADRIEVNPPIDAQSANGRLPANSTGWVKERQEWWRRMRGPDSRQAWLRSSACQGGPSRDCHYQSSLAASSPTARAERVDHLAAALTYADKRYRLSPWRLAPSSS